MADITVSSDIDTFLQSADNAAARASIGADVRTDANGAFSAGDLGGNARGDNAINIQASRSSATQVASNTNSVAIGNNATASGSNSTALGPFSTAAGNDATASGYGAFATHTKSGAFGYGACASEPNSGAFGYRACALTANVQELGYYSDSATRAGAVRVHGTGQVGLTTPTTDTAYLPSVLTDGSEIDGTLAQGMFASRIGSTNNELITEVNRAGTIAKFSAPRIDANGAVSVGDLGGNARGANAINIQAARSAVTRVASGENAVAIGNSTTASGNYSTASGYRATASGQNATASGYNANASLSYATASGNYATASGFFTTALGANATASGYYSTASGYNATSSGYNATAVGRSAVASSPSATALGRNATASGENATASGFAATASQTNSGAFGFRAKSATANVQELGYWSNATTRAGAVRVHGTGYVAISTPQTDTAFTDGGATAGSEADGTILRKGLAFRVSVAGNLIATYCKADGTIITKDLGAMT
jgi:trimeric autotransporter adhesin